MPPKKYLSDGKCPSCGCKYYWLIRRAKRKCADPDCRREYPDSWGKTSLLRDKWLIVARCFVGRRKLKWALRITGLTKKQYLNALKDFRTAIYASVTSTSPVHFTKLLVHLCDYNRLEKTWRGHYGDTDGFFLQECILKRKGISQKNFRFHLAEAVWWKEHIGGGRGEKACQKKVHQIKDLMEEMRNPEIGYSDFQPRDIKRLQDEHDMAEKRRAQPPKW